MDENKKKYVSNNCWKHISDGWIIVADMDEWLCVKEDDLKEEEKAGTTILQVIGLEMIGESKKSDLSDINLMAIKKYIINTSESKNLCFYRKGIEEMNYIHGNHHSYPIGNIVNSELIYANKHMSYLGKLFIIDKTVKRYERSVEMRKIGLDTHYTDDIDEIINRYNYLLDNANSL